MDGKLVASGALDGGWTLGIFSDDLHVTELVAIREGEVYLARSREDGGVPMEQEAGLVDMFSQLFGCSGGDQGQYQCAVVLSSRKDVVTVTLKEKDATGVSLWKKLTVTAREANLSTSKQILCHLGVAALTELQQSRRKARSREQEVKQLQTQAKGMEETMDKMVNAKEEQEQALYEQFVLVLNAKKERLRELRDELWALQGQAEEENAGSQSGEGDDKDDEEDDEEDGAGQKEGGGSGGGGGISRFVTSSPGQKGKKRQRGGERGDGATRSSQLGTMSPGKKKKNAKRRDPCGDSSQAPEPRRTAPPLPPSFLSSAMTGGLVCRSISPRLMCARCAPHTPSIN
uniref:XRCC4 coiled-coil domain-containing protein n=1 Tax=Rhizochromulina marina TaxID=1034831 RepID=A0A7S2W6E9_9STRA